TRIFWATCKLLLTRCPLGDMRGEQTPYRGRFRLVQWLEDSSWISEAGPSVLGRSPARNVCRTSNFSRIGVFKRAAQQNHTRWTARPTLQGSQFRKPTSEKSLYRGYRDLFSQ